MKSSVISVRSRLVDEKTLQIHAVTWSARVANGNRTVLAEAEDDFVTQTLFCKRPDEIVGLTAFQTFTPRCDLEYNCTGSISPAAAMSTARPMLDWLHRRQSAVVAIRRFTFAFEFDSEMDDGRHKPGDSSVYLHWLPHHPANESEIGVDVTIERTRGNDIKARCEWFALALEGLGLSPDIRVRLVEGRRLIIESQPPWEVTAQSTDSTPEKNATAILIAPFDSLESLEARATQFMGRITDRVVSFMTFLEVPALNDYNRLTREIPAECEGWKVWVHGFPAEATLSWLSGNLIARPRGRIPLGRGWEGDPYAGFSYSVSVVETREGPCIELGSARASVEQLQSLCKYFEGLEFQPV